MLRPEGVAYAARLGGRPYTALVEHLHHSGNAGGAPYVGSLSELLIYYILYKSTQHTVLCTHPEGSKSKVNTDPRGGTSTSD